MSIFRDFFVKEKPVFTGLARGVGGFGFGGGGGAGAGGTVTLATGGTVSQPGNGYAYHYFDGVGDIYTSSTHSDTNFSNYTLETRSVGQVGYGSPSAQSFCIVLKSAQETVDIKTQNTGGSTSATYYFWYSIDNGSTFSPHPATHTGSMDGGTATSIGPHPSPYGGVTHVVYSRGSAGSANRYYWAPTPAATFVPNGAKTIDIVMTGGGGGGGGTSGGGAGGLVHYANKAVTTGTITLAIGMGGLHGPGAAPGSDQVGADTTLSGPDFPATITAKGGGGGGAFNVSDLPRAGGSGGGGYSDAGGSNQGPGGPATQPSQNPTYSPLSSFNQYGSNGGAGSTKIGYIAGGGGGGAGGVGLGLPGPNVPNGDYDAANAAVGGPGQAISGFEYALWGRPDLEPLSPSNNHFGGGGGGRPNTGPTESVGGNGGGGSSGGPGNNVVHGIPILGGGAGGGNSNGAGGSGGVIIRYSVT